MAKNTSKTMDFKAMSADELQSYIVDSQKKAEELTMSLSAKNPAEKRALRRNIARAHTQLATQ